MPLVEAAFRTRTTKGWLERLQAQNVPATPILTVDRVLSDPQVSQRGMVVEMDHPLYGKTRTLGTPIKMDGAMGLEVTPAPRPWRAHRPGPDPGAQVLERENRGAARDRSYRLIARDDASP